MIYDDQEWVRLQEEGYSQQETITILNEQRRQINDARRNLERMGQTVCTLHEAETDAKGK